MFPFDSSFLIHYFCLSYHEECSLVTLNHSSHYCLVVTECNLGCHVATALQSMSSVFSGDITGKIKFLVFNGSKSGSFMLSLPHVMFGWRGASNPQYSRFFLEAKHVSCLCVCLSINLSACLFICLSVHQSVKLWVQCHSCQEGQRDDASFPHPSNSTVSATNPLSLLSCFPSWGSTRVTSWPPLLYSRPWNGLRVLCRLSYLAALRMWTRICHFRKTR